MNNLRIAIDGGAATGKSTVSKLVANKLGIRYINTGQMYRLFALVGLNENLLDNEESLANRLKDMTITFDQDGFITSPDYEFELDILDSKEVGANASVVAAMPLVRSIATEKQILVGKENGVLLEGRDIGTVIMPDADYKIFITVDPKVAATRRVNQHEQLGESVDFDSILEDIKERNYRDTNREIAPLVPTDGSIIIDSSNNTAMEIADKIIEVINNG